MYCHPEYGLTQVNDVKAQLLQAEKLVLVLDLDNTLIHCTPFRITTEMVKRNRCFRETGISVFDSLKGKYHMWQPGQYSYLIKVRPFCADFLLSAIEKFKVYFYTAAKLNYAQQVLKVLKMHCKAHLKDQKSDKAVDLTFENSRLISRDDKHKYGSQVGQNQEALRIAERNIIQNQGSQAVNQSALELELWKMNYSRKTLEDYAGGDDRIFVVIDDREDVWLRPEGDCLENLIKIPAYFYFQ